MISVLIATIGRDTLKRSIDSITPQLGDGDELVVAADGPEALVKARRQWPACVLVPGSPHGNWGHTPRNLMIPALEGPWVVHQDDDDTMAPEALANVRRHVAEHPGAVHLYRVLYECGYVIWGEKVVCQGNIGTRFIVHRKEHAGWFDPLLAWGDFNFVKTTVENSGVEPIWHEEYLTHDRPTGKY
jgi:glycosyltransferase involved in cell wall biosynthesis